MKTGLHWLCRIGVAAVLYGSFQLAGAVEPYQEYHKRIEAAQSLTALKNDLMGDSVSLYNGVTDFGFYPANTDTSKKPQSGTGQRVSIRIGSAHNNLRPRRIGR